MEYFDTNIYIYAFCKNIDNENQKDISKKLIRDSLQNNNMLASELILYEFAFVSNKLKEEDVFIEQNLKFIAQFVKPTNPNVNIRVMEILKKSRQYSSSFDVFHLAFCEDNDCKLITFDKGFKKLQNVSKVEVTIM